MRHRPVHWTPLERGNRSIIIFVTVCTKGRRPLLDNFPAAALIQAAWEKAGFWKIGRFVIMPDHVHFFCAPGSLPAPSLVNWMEFWRNQVTRSWPEHDEVPIWQTDFWDRQLRQGESYSEKWEYVRNNPVRHGLVKRVMDWPYQGELNQLFWHEE